MNGQYPIEEIIPSVKETLAKTNTAILQAPPGAGKSTILPLQLLNEPWLKGKKILMLEPRRLAARSVAQRMASLLDEETGDTIGYRVRFDTRIGTNTQLEVLTEGILTRMLQQDNSLEEAGLVIFDEFHERSLHADLALALCREIQQVLRPDLRLLIMSATLDGQQLSSLLGNAPILTSQGRQYPIQHHYIPFENNTPLAPQMVRAIQKALREQEGDILTFLPGSGDIHKVSEALNVEAVVLPLYGDLPFKEQQEAILPDRMGRRKIVLATSIAETSLTIEGIKTVIDSGFSRVPRFDPRTGLTRLETIRVTRDAADQRAGRAGRLGPGVCYRLWAEGTHQHLVPQRTPEILEADLAPLTLELAQWGVQDITTLSWLTPPPSGNLKQAVELLQQLEAMKDGKISDKGREMLKLPTHPRMAHMMLVAKEMKTLSWAADICALMEERDPLGKEAGVNMYTRVEVLQQWRNKNKVQADRNALERIERVAQVWRKIFNAEITLTVPSQEQVGRLIAAAYPERIARKKEQEHARYRLANGRMVKLPEHDSLINEEWLAVAHLDAGVSEGRIFSAAPLNPEEVGYLIQEREELSWDHNKGVLLARKEKRIGDIIVSSSPLDNVPEKSIAVLCKAVEEDGEKLLPWSEEVEEFQTRVMNLKQWRSDEDWPDLSKKHLLNHVSDWLAPYLINFRKKDDFKKLDLLNILKGILSWEQQTKIEEFAPYKIEVPSGSLIKLNYNPDGSAPVLAVRLQELFGLMDTPKINQGRTPVLIHLLSPGYKPVQVTQDLKSFWKNTYPEVRKELRMRYPKHHWPEDPWTAEAVRGVKRNNSKQ